VNRVQFREEAATRQVTALRGEIDLK